MNLPFGICSLLIAANRQLGSEAQTVFSYDRIRSDILAHTFNGKVDIVDSDDRYACLVALVAAWLNKNPVLFMPSSWPVTWKAQALSILKMSKFEDHGDVFYIAPTSGTSGIPKLVLITRSNWEAFFHSQTSDCTLKATDRIALTFQPAFDPFIAVSMLSLARGACLYSLLPNDQFQIFDFCQRNQITVWASTPSLVRLALKRNTDLLLPLIRETWFTGEALHGDVVKGWRNIAKRSTVDNLYGPVETTVWVTRHRVEDSDLADIPIGTPFGQNETTVIDGKLVIAGPQVSPGYLSSHGMKPFNQVFKTEDLVEKNHGSLYFRGRSDAQLKLAGARLEGHLLEQTISGLTQSPCVVGLTWDGLLAAAIAKPHSLIEIKASIRESLPAFYVPHRILVLDDWPTTLNGKTDRKQILSWLADAKRESKV